MEFFYMGPANNTDLTTFFLERRPEIVQVAEESSTDCDAAVASLSKWIATFGIKHWPVSDRRLHYTASELHNSWRAQQFSPCIYFLLPACLWNCGKALSRSDNVVTILAYPLVHGSDQLAYRNQLCAKCYKSSPIKAITDYPKQFWHAMEMFNGGVQGFEAQNTDGPTSLYAGTFWPEGLEQEKAEKTFRSMK